MHWMMCSNALAYNPVLVEAVSVGSAAADLDGDGALDLIEGTHLGPLVRWNLGGNTYSERQLWGSLDGEVAGGLVLHVADLDGDGHAEVCSPQHGTDALVCTLGTGTRTAGATQVLRESVHHALLADLDADLDTDLVWTDGATLYLELNDGLGGFTLAASMPADVDRLVTGDIDGDGLHELYGAADDAVTVYDGLSLATVAGPITSTCVGQTTSLAALDVDADGDDDALTCRGPTFQLLEADAGQLLAPVAQPQLPPASQRDVDGDGFADLVSMGTRTVVLPDDPTSIPTEFGVGVDIHALGFDSDGDGDQEFTATRNGARYIAPNEGGLASWRGMSHAVYRVNGIEAADVDGDGFDDLVVSFEEGLYWRPSLGDGRFGQPVIIERGRWQFDRMRVTDVDGDGHPDLVYHHPSGPFELRWGTGSGFGAPITLGTFGTIDRVDLDLDGVRDEILLTFSDEVFTLDPAGGVVTIANVAPFIVPVATTVADFDDDGLADLAWVKNEGVYTSWGLPGGGFDTPFLGLPFDWDSGQKHLSPIDLNGDGVPDLVASGEHPDLDDQDLLLGLSWDGTAWVEVGRIDGGFSGMVGLVADSVLLNEGHRLRPLEPASFTLGTPWLEGPARVPSYTFSFGVREFPVASDGDVNGDGLLDVVTGGPTEVWVVLGE